MTRIDSHKFALATIFCACFLGQASGDVTWSGDIDPADPTTWTRSIDGYVGRTGTGDLGIDGGSELQNFNAFLGDEFGSSGTVAVVGDGTRWINDGLLQVGSYGDGSLAITDGGDVLAKRGAVVAVEAGSSGRVTVDGSGSLFHTDDSSITVGRFGDAGELSVTNGGVVASDGGTLGTYAGSAGLVTIDGSGSKWNSTGTLTVGRAGHGTLEILNDSLVRVFGRTQIASDPGGSGSIRFDGGTLQTETLFAPAKDLTGTGTIVTDGLVSDIDLVYNATTGLAQTLLINQSVTVQMDASVYADRGIGYAENATMSITDGLGVRSRTTYVGYKQGSQGHLEVAGAGSSFRSSSALYVGFEGTGRLSIKDGATVTSNQITWGGYRPAASSRPGSTGEIHFDNGTLNTESLLAPAAGLIGTGTINTEGIISDIDLVFDATRGLVQSFTLNQFPGQNITVNLDKTGSDGLLGAGYSGNGSLTIADGLQVSGSRGYLGFRADGYGEALVTGPGSTWTTEGFFDVGHYGQGRLEVTSGGTVDFGSGSIGTWAGSSGHVVVDGAGTTWTSEREVNVGFFGDGSLAITGGALARNGSAFLGKVPGSSGMASVDGQNSIWEVDRFEVGARDAEGELTITGGGQLRTGQSGIARGLGSVGHVTVEGEGSSWSSTSSLSIGTLGVGTLEVIRGADVDSLFGTIGSSTETEVSATVLVGGESSTWTIGRYLTMVGASPATLTIQGGGYVSVAFGLNVFENENQNATINMATGGMLALAGQADASIEEFLNLGDGVAPIHYWDADLAAWAPVASATVGEDYTLEYFETGDLAGFTLLTVGEIPLEGDFNRDGSVDLADLTLWRNNLGVVGINLPADGNFDGRVDESDYSIWRANYGAIDAAASPTNTVPEPTTLLLAVLGVGGGLCLRKCQNLAVEFP